MKAHCDPTEGGNKVDPHVITAESKQKEGGETEDKQNSTGHKQVTRFRREKIHKEDKE